MHTNRITFMLLAVLLAATGCSSGGAGDQSQTVGGQVAERTAGDGDALSLAGVCPETIVIQTSWWTQIEHFVAYQLLGEGYTVDAAHKRVTGPLVAQGVDTGVDIQIRAGGPAIGFETVTAQMYLDQAITIGMVPTDEIIQLSADQPLTAVATPFDLDPQVIMWSPDTHPDWKTIVDIGQTDTPVIYAESTGTYMQFLIGAGVLRESQVDPSYDGSPDRFVSSGGDIAIQGFATNEPYTWANELPDWNKPIEYELIADRGYPNYRHVLAVRAGKLQELTPCLERLVPIFQQAIVDFMAKPDPVIGLVLNVVDQTRQPSNDSKARSEHAVEVMRTDNIVTNGDDTTVGEFDPQRLENLIRITTPIFDSQNQPIKANLTWEDIATNTFIDPEIGLPAGDQ